MPEDISPQTDETGVIDQLNQTEQPEQPESGSDVDAKVAQLVDRATEAFASQNLDVLDEALFDLGEELGIEIEPPTITIEGKKFPISRLEIGGKNKEELVQALEGKGIKITNEARFMIDSPEFTTQEKSERITTIRLKVSDLGLPDRATTDQIYAKAEELGLDLCPAEVGPYQRLKDQDQPINVWYTIAMRQIADRDGGPSVFDLEHCDGAVWLHGLFASPYGNFWFADRGFMFRLRPSTALKAGKDSLET